MTRAAAILVHREMRLTTGKLFARLKEMIGALLCLLRSQRSTLLPPASNRLFLATIHCALIIALFSAPAFSQTGTATINGQITDPQGRIVPNVSVQAVNTATNVVYPGKTNSSGIYSIGSLPPGPYRMVVSSAGFKEINSINLVLHTQDTLEQNFALEVGSVSESVTVNANTTNDFPAVSMTVDREFVENMPLNGRSFQDLIQLAPGVAASNGSPGTPGYYSINGQRTDSNDFVVDGVSANLGGLNNAPTSVGGALSGSAPAQTALGTTQSLASIDALKEFKIQTSGYTAEFGRTPGGQIQFTTRSGTNDIHGTLFEYLRNTAFDANSFINGFCGEPKSAEHQNDFGGTIGGPLIVPKLYDGKDKTFFFISYERLRLLLPSFESEYVPTQAFRSWASPNVQPFLSAKPVPNGPINQDGCTIPDPSTGQPTACDALFTYGYSYPNNLDSISVRVDQNLGERFHLFVRYADTPSSVSQGAEQTYNNATNVHTLTAGLTTDVSKNLLNELRFNFSHDGEQFYYGQRSVDGSVPLERSLLIPAAFDNQYASGYATIYVSGSSLYLSPSFSGTDSTLRQYQIVDSLAWTEGTHSFKFGGDWRRLNSLYASSSYASHTELQSLAAIQQGYATSVLIQASAPGQPVFDNLSLYTQDHWRISPRMSIDYGLRWEFNPVPGPSNGHYPATLTSSNLATATVAPAGTKPYKTNFHSFAPRFGFAWNAIPSTRYPLTIRGGFGIFFDTGQQTIGNAYACSTSWHSVNSPSSVKP
jgi:hypothetical protein